ncbi:MAG: hypothetical protein AAF614_28130 [Chloroflexota bacterium]
MQEKIADIRINGLNRIEKLELQKNVDTQFVEFYEEPLEGSQYGELMTTAAVVVITVVALKGLAVWLLKTSFRQQITKTIEIEFPDGRKEKHTINIDVSGKKAPEEEVLKELSNVLKVDPKLLSGL